MWYLKECLLAISQQRCCVVGEHEGVPLQNPGEVQTSKSLNAKVHLKLDCDFPTTQIRWEPLKCNTTNIEPLLKPLKQDGMIDSVDMVESGT